jgi:hypothetical protein
MRLKINFKLWGTVFLETALEMLPFVLLACGSNDVSSPETFGQYD